MSLTQPTYLGPRGRPKLRETVPLLLLPVPVVDLGLRGRGDRPAHEVFFHLLPADGEQRCRPRAVRATPERRGGRQKLADKFLQQSSFHDFQIQNFAKKTEVTVLNF